MWEIGLARVDPSSQATAELWDWLGQLYRTPAPKAETFDSYLHEAGKPNSRATRGRADLSWWALLEMVPAWPQNTPPWIPKAAVLTGQGFAVFRNGERYVGLECGSLGGGHGHADRLNLIVHADSEYWLPDFGTGSYVGRDLHWYRSTLAHNAPRLDGVSQARQDATCENFDRSGDWAWARGRFGPLTRSVVAGPGYLLDVVELAGTEEHTLELPWHVSGRVSVEPPGSWQPADLNDQFVQKVERLVGEAGPRVLRTQGANGAMSIYLPAEGDLLRVAAPGTPGSPEPATFYLIRARGRNLRLVSVLEPSHGDGQVREVRQKGATIEVETVAGLDRHGPTVEGWEVQTRAETRRLAGNRKNPAPFEPLVRGDRPLLATGIAPQVLEPPALDGTLEGFDPTEPLQLDHEDQYRRSEEPYAGPEEFSATATVNWSDEAVYLAIDVIKSEVIPRNPKAAPLRLDNEPDEIQVDGVQVYFMLPPEDTVSGFLIVPSTEDGAVIVREIAGNAGTAHDVQGRWAPIDGGYRLTLAITPPGWSGVRRGDLIGFDLLVNEMQSGRLRRAGQMVWSGGGGWVWLRGDRQEPSRFGKLELR
jgi:hypothetical protein